MQFERQLDLRAATYLNSCHQTKCEQTSETKLLGTVKRRPSTISADSRNLKPRFRRTAARGRAMSGDIGVGDASRKQFGNSDYSLIDTPDRHRLWACHPKCDLNSRTGSEKPAVAPDLLPLTKHYASTATACEIRLSTVRSSALTHSPPNPRKPPSFAAFAVRSAIPTRNVR